MNHSSVTNGPEKGNFIDLSFCLAISEDDYGKQDAVLAYLFIFKIKIQSS